MLADCGDADIEKPCNTCTIVRVAPHLEYADGKDRQHRHGNVAASRKFAVNRST